MTDHPLEGIAAIAVGVFLCLIVRSDFRDGRLTYAKGRWLERAQFPYIVWTVHLLFGTMGLISIAMGLSMLLSAFV